MRRLLLTLVALGLVALAAAPALAHSDLVDGSPGPGDELAPGVSVLRLEFEDLDAAAPGYLALSDEAGRPLRVGDAKVTGDSVCARSEALGPGVYALDYIVSDADGHRLEGRFEFAVADSGEEADPGRCEGEGLAAVQEARTIEEATGGGLPGWAPWAIGGVAVVAGAALVARVLRDRRADQSPA